MAIDTLGCGQYEVYFKSRGGDYFICRARNLTGVQWSRKLNDVSDARITIALNGLDEECCNCVDTINPWEHEIAIYRDGVEVWCGPVVNGDIDLAALTATYEARDLSAWFDHRWVELKESDKEFEEAKVSDVYTWLIEHAYYKEQWNMSWLVPSLDVPIDRTYTAATDSERWSGSFQNIGSELRDLAKSGIDFTTIRRSYIAGELMKSSVIEATLIDRHWSTLPKISIVGSAMATEVGMGGGNGGYYGWYDDQIWIERPNDEYRQRFGLLQSFFTAPELDEEETTSLPNGITQQAFSLRELKKEPFVYVKGGSLAQDAPVTFDQLIPGRVFNVALTETCRKVEDSYRLFQVDVNYGASGEDVALQMTPLGAEALRT